MAECDIFREQLAIRYPEHGHALWQPSPRYPDKPVQVGDVGFIRKGEFHRLFNVLLPENDPSHECGVPNDHKRLVPNLSDHLRRGSLARYHYCSAGVSVGPDPALHARAGDIPQVRFTKDNSLRGAAVLSLPVNARREDTLSDRDFRSWIVEHIDSWFAFAQNLGPGIDRMEEIILVTGCDRTKSWANIAFFGSQDGSHVSFGVRVENPDPGITFQSLPENAQGAVLNHGPEGKNLPENQCVFIRGYRVARSFWKLPRQRLKAAAGPFPDAGGYYDCDSTNVSVAGADTTESLWHALLDDGSYQGVPVDTTPNFSFLPADVGYEKETSPTSPCEKPGPPFECDICHKHFMQKQGLSRHHREQHQPPFECWHPHCPQVWTGSRKSEYRRHLREKHGLGDIQIEAILAPPPVIKSETLPPHFSPPTIDDSDMEVIPIPATTRYHDPLYLLLDYISLQAFDCDMVLVHDDDLVKIDGLGHDSSLETLKPDVMMDLLLKSNLEIQKVPYVSANESGPSTHTSVVRIAMLSMKP